VNHLRSAQVWHVFSRDLSCTCTPTRSSAIRMSHTCLCLPSYRLVLIYRPRRERRPWVDLGEGYLMVGIRLSVHRIIKKWRTDQDRKLTVLKRRQCVYGTDIYTTDSKSVATSIWMYSAQTILFITSFKI